MISVTLLDGSVRRFDAAPSGFEVASAIGSSLARAALAIKIDGQIKDLAATVTTDATVEIVTAKSPEALELIRHDAAHILAEAVQELYPGTQVTFGPATENGFYYDFARDAPFSSDDLSAIEARMHEIVERDEKILREEWDRDDAVRLFNQRGEKYKAEWLGEIDRDAAISLYRQGQWLDLCTGPHLPSTGRLGHAFKLMKVAGAYWRGDARNQQLQRIYGTAFATQDELDAYLKQLEEAEKRDHRRLGREMNLFHFQDEAPGSVFWRPHGWTLFQSLIAYMRKRQNAAGYVEINTPDIMDRSLWELSGHWEKFGDNMFVTEPREERVYALKPMSCPGAVQIFKQGIKSYRDLPLHMAEFGKVHRYEPHGALHGLLRVRAFTQDDAHIFCTEDQISQECLSVCDLILSIYRDFGFHDVRIKFSDRPARRVGSDDIWDKSETALKQAVEATGLPYTVNPGEGAFYGPKLEFVLRDAIHRDWQCGTLQVDLNLPGRLGAFYIGEDGQKHVPVMLHQALFGSLERFTGILIEHYAGKLPLWLAPLQIVIATITRDGDDYARRLLRRCQEGGLRAELDLRNEKIAYKIREHSLAKVPVLLVIGKREAERGEVAVRRLDGKAQEILALDEALHRLIEEARSPNRPAAGSDGQRAHTGDTIERRAQ